MINARKILRNVKNLPHRGKMGLHSGSQMWLVDYVCEDGIGNIPLEVMHMCLRMYIGQGCENGKKHLSYGYMTYIRIADIAHSSG